MNLRASILLRMRIACFVGAVGACAIFFKILHVQYTTPKQQLKPEALQPRHMSLFANRGNIYASEGSLLATSLPFYKLAMDPTLPTDFILQTDLDSLCYYLSTYFKEDSLIGYKQRILKARAASKRYILLSKKEIGHQEKKKFMKWPLIREGQWVGGIILEKTSKRFRPFGYMALRTIGHLDWKQRGIVGLEHSFDEVLGGEDGRVLIARAAGGKWYPLYDGSEIYPHHGKDIITTLDPHVQEVAQNSLLKALYKHRAHHGAVAVMDVHTGELKAMVNLTRTKHHTYESSYNYIVGSQGVVEPGSTFKLVTMLALLEETSLQLEDTVDTGEGVHNFYNESMYDTKKGGYGKITVREAFEKSSNIGLARLAVKYFEKNPDHFINYIRKLKLHKSLGFQLKGEGESYIKTPSDSSWSGTSLPWMAHGYELKVSPLHILTLYNGIAAGGKMIAPLLVRTIMKEGEIEEKFEAHVVQKRMASEEVIAQIQSLLLGVVKRGTAQNIHSPFYPIAGKTGTTKKYTNGGYRHQYYTSFVGYFPANQPQYTCLVLIDDPKEGKFYGADVAAPVFRNISDKLCRKGLAVSLSKDATDLPRIGGGWLPDIQFLCKELSVSYQPHNNLGWVRTKAVNGKVHFWKVSAQHKIPDLRGMTYRDALYLLENQGLKVLKKGKGLRVVTQSLRPGSTPTLGQKITLNMG